MDLGRCWLIHVAPLAALVASLLVVPASAFAQDGDETGPDAPASDTASADDDTTSTEQGDEAPAQAEAPSEPSAPAQETAPVDPSPPPRQPQNNAAPASEPAVTEREPSGQEPASGSPFDAESYIALSADQDAQESLGGFRRYLERTRQDDTDLYRVLDARLEELESQETAADVIFWTATGLGAASLIAAIPVHETLGLDPAIGFMVAGGGVFLLGVLIQAIVRPGRSDLVSLIDLHDERLGRR